MTTPWYTIPGRDLFDADSVKDARRCRALERLQKALGEDCLKSLMDKNQLLLVSTFQGHPRLAEISGLGQKVLPACAVYLEDENRVYADVSRCFEPAFVAEVLAACIFRNSEKNPPEHQEFLDLVRVLAKRASRMKKSPTFDTALMRRELTKTPFVNAVFISEWLRNYEGRKSIPDIDEIENKGSRRKQVSMAAFMRAAFSSLRLFKNSAAKALSAGEAYSKARLPVATCVKPTAAQFDDFENFETHDPEAVAEFPYPVNNSKRDNRLMDLESWNLNAEKSNVPWPQIFAGPADFGTSVNPLSLGIVLAGKAPQNQAWVDTIETYRFDVAKMKILRLGRMPFACGNLTSNFVAQIREVYVPKTLDRALMVLDIGRTTQYRVTVVNTSWLAQCSRLKLNTPTTVDLCLWADDAQVSPVQKPRTRHWAVEAEICPQKKVPHYRLTAKVNSVLSCDSTAGKEYVLMEVTSGLPHDGNSSAITLALSKERFDELKIDKKTYYNFTGILLATAFHSDSSNVQLSDFEIRMIEHKMNPLALRRTLNNARSKNALTESGLKAFLDMRAHALDRPGRHPLAISALIQAAGAGVPWAMTRVLHILERAGKRSAANRQAFELIRRTYAEIFSKITQRACEGRENELAFLLYEVQNRWSAIPDDIFRGLERHLAYACRNSRACHEIAKRLRAGRPLSKLGIEETQTYREHLNTALLIGIYLPALRDMMELMIGASDQPPAYDAVVMHLLALEKDFYPVRYWYAAIALLQEKFFSATEEEIFRTLKDAASHGSPLFICSLAWFLIASSIDKPKKNALRLKTGVALLQWLADRYGCPIYTHMPEDAEHRLNDCGVFFEILEGDFNPWTALGMDEPHEEVHLIQCMRPTGDPRRPHLFFMGAFADITADESFEHLGAQLGATFDFLIEHGEVIESSVVKTDDGRQTDLAQLIRYEQEGQSDCLLTRTQDEEGLWHLNGVCPVLEDGCELDMTLLGGYTNMGCSNGVLQGVSDTCDTDSLKYFYDPYWLRNGKEILVGQNKHVRFYGLGLVKQIPEAVLHTVTDIPGRITCETPHRAVYTAFCQIHRVQADAAVAAGAPLSKIVVNVSNFEPGVEETHLPIYVPKKMFTSGKFKRNQWVFLMFELHGVVSDSFESWTASHTVN